MKKWFILAFLMVLASVVGFYFTKLNAHPIENDREGVTAIWASSASSVAEVLAEANLVVRVKVIGDPEPRIVSFSGPMLAEDGSVIGEGTDTMTFSDTQMEVLEVYKGITKEIITVMQTGSISPGASDSERQGSSIEGDPIFEKGEEFVLFLVDISDDSIHAQGRNLYRIVNPAGRYTIQGSQVYSEAEYLAADYPLSLDELIKQIELALAQETE
jgi:hypothetical protein